MMSLITIVIPFYNNAHTIERALTSVRSQTYTNFDVIIVNDCSPDWLDAELIIKTFSDLSIEIIHHDKNKNGSAARNTGIKAAKGEFIALLDADDEWFPDHLKMSRNHYNEQVNKNTVIYCKELVKTSNYKDIVMPQRSIGLNEDLSEYMFCNDGFIQTSSLFIPRFILLNNMFNETLIRHQDYDLVLRLFRSGIVFSMINQVNVILHWEGNDIEKKGGTWKFSLNWAINNKKLFTKKSFRHFVISNAVFPLLQKREKFSALNVFTKYCIGFYQIKFSCKILSMFLFGKVVYSKI